MIKRIAQTAGFTGLLAALLCPSQARRPARITSN